MAIKIILRDGLACPYFFCDRCGDRIDDEDKGILTFSERGETAEGDWMAKDGDELPVIISCKQCDLRTRRSQKPSSWISLGRACIHLLNNMGVKTNEQILETKRRAIRL